jgi:hypothetical protein
MRLSAWLRLRDVHPYVASDAEAATIFHVCAAVAAGLLTQKQIEPTLRKLTATCFFLQVYILATYHPRVDCAEAFLSLPIAGTIGALALLWKIRLNLSDRFKAWFILITPNVYWGMIIYCGDLKWTVAWRWFGTTPDYGGIYASPLICFSCRRSLCSS